MNFFRQLPSIHEVMQSPEVKSMATALSRDSVVSTVRIALQEIRDDLKENKGEWDAQKVQLKIREHLYHLKRSHFRRVINATGVLIHTNLGRAPLSPEALKKIIEIGGGYSSVEYHLERGGRGERNDLVEEMFCILTGAESALVVNNNAAAVLLCLNTISDQKGVLVSRGELVEIGNSFRMPDIMAKSGARLREIGTTNKTKVGDYEAALNPASMAQEISLILKVHTSNYEIVGFTQEVSLKDLVKCARRYKKPVLFDAGSGFLSKRWPSQSFSSGAFREPSIEEAVKTGADLITFSGDKLLGGPQTGIILGKKRWMERLKKNPLYRALRVDKIVLAALEETLRHYLSNEADKIPFLKMLFLPLEVLERRACEVREELENHFPSISLIEVERDVAKVGGGAFPGMEVPTVALSFLLPKEKLLAFEKSLRYPHDPLQMPVIGRIQKNRYLIDFRTVFEEDLAPLKENLKRAISVIIFHN